LTTWPGVRAKTGQKYLKKGDLITFL